MFSCLFAATHPPASAENASPSAPEPPTPAQPAAAAVPEPIPAQTPLLVGAHYFPGWRQGSQSIGWEVIAPWPEREPVLGWYDEGDPDVADWEIKWALEHGLSFFVYCWYRNSQGGPVEMRLGHAIHDGLFRARYRDRFKFCIMWENQSRGRSGVASEADLMENLLPYWIETYFSHPSYLKIDGKPILFVYRPEYLIDDLGSEAAARTAVGKMREACRAAGFEGLTLLGEYRGTQAKPLERMKALGFDYSFPYCWPLPGNPAPEQAVDAQVGMWKTRRELGVLPDIVTVSMGWDSRPWHPSSTIWRLPPDDFRRACEQARSFVAAAPETCLSSRMILLDNWNEYGEGHYIAPHREHGFGYLDAVRAALTDTKGDHADLAPKDVGLGPYDSLYRAWQDRQTRCRRIVTAPGHDQPGLVAWWRFDESDGDDVAVDSSGNGLGGMADDVRREPGRSGRAMRCDGGSVSVSNDPRFTQPGHLSITAWIRTDSPEQTDRWFVNCSHSGGATGYRLGVSDGRLRWGVPITPWSHHLSATRPLPAGRWVHVAAVYDGRTIQLFMDGEPAGTAERSGPINPTTGPLVLGNFSTGHAAHFIGLVDEIRLWSRALPPEEIIRLAAED